MVLSIGAAALALRAGLAMRRARLLGRGRTPDMLRRHLRLAKLAVTLILIGFAAGPLSMLWLRGREPFGTVHALLGGTAATLFAVTAVLGWRLERGAAIPLNAHALAGLLAVLAAATAAAAGFVLLP